MSKYSIKELGFILYNNRSVKGVIQNFLLDKSINPLKLIDIENKFSNIKNINNDNDKMVEINVSLLDNTADDLIVHPNDLTNLTDIFKSNIGKFSKDEKAFLRKRKLPMKLIRKWKMFGLSNIKGSRNLDIIGATCHPILRKLLKDGIDEGGIVAPLYDENDKLVNCSIRRITDVGKLKYTLAVPDVPVWGIDDVSEGDEIWICEGIFDMITLREFGVKAVSPSSAMWSGIQLYKLVEKKPKNIIIMADNDRVGLKTALLLNSFFEIMGIPSLTVHSKFCKDACEHFYERKLNFDDIEYILIDDDMIKEKVDESFNFLKYLQTRKF